MKTQKIKFSSSEVNFYFDASLDYISSIFPIEKIFILTDENIFKKNKSLFFNYKTIVIKAGESYKNIQTVENIIKILIQNNAQRNSILIGVGGGVITDITGFVASTFLRGIKFGFVPTSLLAMVDASIGGKNGVDIDVYKNMVGVINQPNFILYDLRFLHSLPKKEWINGFAEIIKHSCIKNKSMFHFLQEKNVPYFQQNIIELSKLIQQNVQIKTKIVQIDEFEQGDRKLLNFGHTFGHAIENTYNLSHGNAVSIGMVIAANISHNLNAFKNSPDLISLLKKYGLKTTIDFNIDDIIQIIQKDKKMLDDNIQFILLKSIGKSYIEKISLKNLKNILQLNFN